MVLPVITGTHRMIQQPCTLTLTANWSELRVGTADWLKAMRSPIIIVAIF